MSNDMSNCTSINVTNNRAGAKGALIRDLRQEILTLRAELRECEVVAARHIVMLREGDHRIKNSLQLVASLMRLQATREPGTSTRFALRAAAARVSSVASIHDALQGAGGGDRVDLGATLRKMCASLHAMAGDEGLIQVIVEAEPVELPVALAQPLVLAVNELVVNALRHAFTDDEAGNVRVNLAASRAEVTLSVTDDGNGLDAKTGSARGYGMSLVDMMVQQINGTLTMRSGATGTMFTITARMPAPMR